MATSTLFGAPLGYSESSLFRWIAALESLWESFAKTSSATVNKDLVLLGRAFNTGIAPKALRPLVAGIGEQDFDAGFLPSEVCLDLDGTFLITPEGRVLLEVLKMLQVRGKWVISPEEQMEAMGLALQYRASSQRDWMERQFGGPISVPAVAAAIFILTNGSIGVEKAFLIPREPHADRDLAAMVSPCIEAFCAEFQVKSPDLSTGLRSSYAFTQLSRRLSKYVSRSKTDSGALIYVRPDLEDELVNDLARRLSDRDQVKVERALDSFVAAYEVVRGSLLNVEQSYETASHTRRTIRALKDRDQV